ncbi:MAG: hypothetical protein ACTSRZ_20715 [Promethearchaeota archaeon]
MPGVNFIFDKRGIKDYLNKINQAKQKMYYLDFYKFELIEENPTMHISSNNYEGYPIQVFENQEYKIILEGEIYNFYNSYLSENPSRVSFNNSSELESFILSIAEFLPPLSSPLNKKIDNNENNNETKLNNSSGFNSQFNNVIHFYDLMLFNYHLRKIDGEFLITIINKVEKVIYFFGTLFGHIPIYYKIINDKQGNIVGIIVSRDITFIRTLSFDGLDLMGIMQSLFFTTTLEGRTLFKNICKMPKGGIISMSFDLNQWNDLNNIPIRIYSNYNKYNLELMQNKKECLLIKKEDLEKIGNFENKNKIIVKPNQLYDYLNNSVRDRINNYFKKCIKENIDNKNRFLLLSLSGGIDSRIVFYSEILTLKELINNNDLNKNDTYELKKFLRINSILEYKNHEYLKDLGIINNKDLVSLEKFSKLIKSESNLPEKILDFYVASKYAKLFNLKHFIFNIYGDNKKKYNNLLINMKDGQVNAFGYPQLEYFLGIRKKMGHLLSLYQGDTGFSLRPLPLFPIARKMKKFVKYILSTEERFFTLHNLPLDKALEFTNISYNDFENELFNILKLYPEKSVKYKLKRFFFENHVNNWLYEKMDINRHILWIETPLESTPLLYASLFYPFKKKRRFKLDKKILNKLDSNALDIMISNYKVKFKSLKGSLKLFYKDLKLYLANIIKMILQKIPKKFKQKITNRLSTFKHEEFRDIQWVIEESERDFDILKVINPNISKKKNLFLDIQDPWEIYSIYTLIKLIKLIQSENME